MMDYEQQLAEEIDRRLRNRKTLRKVRDRKVLQYVHMDEQHPDASTADDLISMVYMKIKEMNQGEAKRFFLKTGYSEGARGSYYETLAVDLLNEERKPMRDRLYRGGPRLEGMEEASAEDLFFGCVEQAWQTQQRMNNRTVLSHDAKSELGRMQDLKWGEKPNAPQNGQMITKTDYKNVRAFGDLSNLMRDRAYKKLKAGQKLLAVDLIKRIKTEIKMGELVVDRQAVANFLGMNAHSIDRWRDDGTIRGIRIEGNHGKKVWGYDLIEVVERLLGLESEGEGAGF